MPFDPLVLMSVSALLLLAAGGAAAARLGGVVGSPDDVSAPTERTAALPDRDGELLDPLTGIGNRLALHRSGAPLLASALRDGRRSALLLMDLDRFAVINATHGSATGDRLLVAFAHVVHDYLPPTSLVCRLGADTFAAILPGADPARARAIADEIRMLFAHVAIESPRGRVSTTVSIGIAEPSESSPTLETLLQQADLRLDRAKAAGRNRVEGDPRPDAAPRRRRWGAA